MPAQERDPNSFAALAFARYVYHPSEHDAMGVYVYDDCGQGVELRFRNHKDLVALLSGILADVESLPTRAGKPAGGWANLHRAERRRA